ncbi:hypothetical protein [Algivirga pacifica]|uniref:Uncharacterized protein n=1 Tax=Algivirga pacifica TaxID=1162670 RepID=A0ABP9D9I1_9BACT
MRRRKNYPGDLRQLGTKDYSLILGNLMNYRNQLIRETEDQKIGALFLKISEKLKELGYSKASTQTKNKAGVKKQGKFENITLKKKKEVVEISLECWKEGKEKHEEAKRINKEKEKQLKDKQDLK